MTFSTERNSLISDDDLATMLSYAEQAPPGAFVEVGVYRGGSARRLYEIAERQGRAIWLYDTFAGHPEPDRFDSPEHPKGRYADCADPDALLEEMPNAAIYVGRFYPFSPAPQEIAFAHIDVDLYESTRDSIEALAPLMVPNGIMYFDDYGYPDTPGATRAIDERFQGGIQILDNGKAIVRRPNTASVLL